MPIAGIKALAMALAIGLSALATSMAQAKIGSAGAGAVAEKPEIFGLIIALVALPELLVLLGFVVVFLIMGVK